MQPLAAVKGLLHDQHSTCTISTHLRAMHALSRTHAQVGEEAKKLFNEAQAMLKEFIEQKHVTLNAIVGIYPANAVGDDIEVYADEARGEPVATFYGLRQQSEKEDKADPCAPVATLPHSHSAQTCIYSVNRLH
jgi:cobalamin-dependent methionine synthase I